MIRKIQMKKLIFATTNENKLFEVKKLLKNYYDVVGLKEIGFEHNIIENKSSIIGNSIHKALFVKEKTGFNCFADDTGLEVDVLDGAPGVHSKRYAGINASSEDNINKLLNSLISFCPNDLPSLENRSDHLVLIVDKLPSISATT